MLNTRRTWGSGTPFCITFFFWCVSRIVYVMYQIFVVAARLLIFYFRVLEVSTKTSLVSYMWNLRRELKPTSDDAVYYIISFLFKRLGWWRFVVTLLLVTQFIVFVYTLVALIAVKWCWCNWYQYSMVCVRGESGHRITLIPTMIMMAVCSPRKTAKDWLLFAFCCHRRSRYYRCFEQPWMIVRT